jgi:hypothetical protein
MRGHLWIFDAAASSGLVIFSMLRDKGRQLPQDDVGVLVKACGIPLYGLSLASSPAPVVSGFP